MHIVHIAIISFFSVWLVATVINQFNYNWVRVLREIDIFHILPRWTFFAPNPGTSDYHILFRQMDDDNNISEFHEVPVYGKKKFFTFLWNPQKRAKKSLIDLSVDMKRLVSINRLNPENIKLSFNYIAFLNFYNNEVLNPNTKYIQFAVMVTTGYIEYEDPYLLICSEFHHV